MNPKIDTNLEKVIATLVRDSLAQGRADQLPADVSTRRVWALLGLDDILPGITVPILDSLRVITPEAREQQRARFVTSEDSVYHFDPDLFGDDDGDTLIKPITGTGRWTKSGGLLFEFEQIHFLLNRDESGKLYKDEYNDAKEGKQARIIAAKIMSDLLAGFERDYRLRHRTGVRMRLHNAASRLVAGSDQGTVNNIKRFVGVILNEAEAEVLQTDGTLPEVEK